MPKCAVCGREFKIINSQHLATHDMTMAEYVEQYGKPDNRVKSDAGSVAKKLKNKGKKKQHYSITNLLDSLYAADRTIVIPKKFKIIRPSNRYLIEQMIREAKESKIVFVDTETTGLELYTDYITDVIITIGNEPTYAKNYFIPTSHIDRDGILLPDQFDRSELGDLIRPIMEDPEITKGFFLAYFDIPRIKVWLNCDTLGKIEDAFVASKIMNENEKGHRLKPLYGKYIDEQDEEIKALGAATFDEKFGKLKFYNVPMNVAIAYGAKDGYMTRRLHEFYDQYLYGAKKIGKLSDIYELEMSVQPIIIDMLIRGMNVDLDMADALNEKFSITRDEVKVALEEEIGDVNLNSPKQVAVALFDVLGYPEIEGRSVKAKVLEQLSEQGCDAATNIITFRKYDKIIGTYLAGIRRFIPDATGKIHCRFNALGTTTGRFSSSDPNLQNIPARDKRFKAVRRIFCAAEGNVLISCDYSQIEPRILAHMSEDKKMQFVYNSGRDLYSTMACEVFTIVASRFADLLNNELVKVENYHEGLYPQLIKDSFVAKVDTGYTASEVKYEDCYDGTLYRRVMKTLLLGLMYSMSEKGLAGRLGLAQNDAMMIMDSFFHRFPKITTYVNHLETFCIHNGYVLTILGRKRRLPNIYSDQWFVRNKTKRQILNSVIQGSAADVMKLAIVKVGRDKRISDLGGTIDLTVHDELIVEVAANKALECARYLSEDMSSAIDLSVPMKADCEIYVDGDWYGRSVVYANSKEGWKLTEGKVSITENYFNSLCLGRLPKF